MRDRRLVAVDGEQFGLVVCLHVSRIPRFLDARTRRAVVNFIARTIEWMPCPHVGITQSLSCFC
jgi:hypothetical protein